MPDVTACTGRGPPARRGLRAPSCSARAAAEPPPGQWAESTVTVSSRLYRSRKRGRPGWRRPSPPQPTQPPCLRLKGHRPSSPRCACEHWASGPDLPTQAVCACHASLLPGRSNQASPVSVRGGRRSAHRRTHEGEKAPQGGDSQKGRSRGARVGADLLDPPVTRETQIPTREFPRRPQSCRRSRARLMASAGKAAEKQEPPAHCGGRSERVGPERTEQDRVGSGLAQPSGS